MQTVITHAGLQVDTEEAHSAALTVAENGKSPEETLTFLRMLGLVEEEPETE